MDIIQRYENVIYPVAGLNDKREECLLGLSRKRAEEMNDRGNAARVGQFKGLVQPGLICATTLFQGLQRRLMQRDNTEADADKFVYVWKPSWDFEWEYADRFYPSKIKRLPAPEGGVFFVIATHNTVPKYHKRYPEIFAWIERWGWLKESPAKPGVPVDYDSRYEKVVWEV